MTIAWPGTDGLWGGSAGLGRARALEPVTLLLCRRAARGGWHARHHYPPGSPTPVGLASSSRHPSPLDQGGVLRWSWQPRTKQGKFAPSFRYSTGMFHLRVMSRHARLNRLRPHDRSDHDQGDGAMRTVVGRHLRDVDVG
jgi:hypothetical protein